MAARREQAEGRAEKSPQRPRDTLAAPGAAVRWQAECASFVFRLDPQADKSSVHRCLSRAAHQPALRSLAPPAAASWVLALEPRPEFAPGS